MTVVSDIPRLNWPAVSLLEKSTSGEPMNGPGIAVIDAILSNLVNKVNYHQASIVIDQFGLDSAACADSAGNEAGYGRIDSLSGLV